MTRPALKSTARTALLAAALAGLTAAGGCASSSASTRPSAGTRPASVDKLAGLTERERTVARVTQGPPGLGFFRGLLLKASYFVSDMADGISGAGARYGRMLADKNDPETRRQGITELADRPWGQTTTFTVAYARIAEDETQDYLVRATAVRALNRSRERRFTSLYVKDLSDANILVRLEACKALNRMPDASAVPDLVKLLGRAEENKDVRIAAADALRHYKRLDVARSLAGALAERDFGIAWQAKRSLHDITQKDFGYDEGKWLTYFTGPEKPLG